MVKSVGVVNGSAGVMGIVEGGVVSWKRYSVTCEVAAGKD